MTKNTRPNLKGSFDAFMPDSSPPPPTAETAKSQNVKASKRHGASLGGRPGRADNVKVTVYLPPASFRNLEDAWMKARSKKGQRVTKSALIGLILDEFGARVFENNLLDKIDSYLEGNR